MFSPFQVGRRRILSTLLLALLGSLTVSARASVGLLLEEPFGRFGDLNPTGHAALYFDRLCADTPTRVRECKPGELGVVISRYHRVGGYDWIAIPLIPYLYAVDSLTDVPSFATEEEVFSLRDAYRRRNLTSIAPDTASGGTPEGEWIQLVGSSYDRRIYSFELETTPQQDRIILNRLNESHNQAHFNLFFHNCADFSRTLLNGIYPRSIHRNVIADFDLTTPKQVARSVRRYARAHPELVYNEYCIPQVPGSSVRSRHISGIAESIARSKKYVVPLAFLTPTTAGTIVAAYLGAGRFSPPAQAPLMPELDVRESTPLLLNADVLRIDGLEDTARPIHSWSALKSIACTPATFDARPIGAPPIEAKPLVATSGILPSGAPRSAIPVHLGD